MKTCGATFALANGEAVTPCHKPDGHDGEHEGWCLGSRAVWNSDEKHTSEEEEYWKRKAALATAKNKQERQQ